MSGRSAARVGFPRRPERSADSVRRRFRLAAGAFFLTMLVVLSPIAASFAAAAPTATILTTLPAGQPMRVGAALVSPNEQYRAEVKSDGNFVVRGPDGAAIWQSKTVATGSRGAVMVHAQGEIMVYQTDTAAVKWQAGTHGTGAGSSLVLRNDGALALVSAGRATIWTNRTGLTGVRRGEMHRGTTIGAGQSLVSLNGKFRAGVLLNGGLGIWGLDGKVTWSAGTKAPTTTTSGGSSRFRLGHDSQLSVVGSTGVVRWHAATTWSDVRRVAVSDYGNLVAYGASDSLIWSSNYGRVWTGRGTYTGGTDAYQRRVRTLMTELGCGAVNVQITAQSGGSAIPTENRIRLENNMAEWEFGYVIDHECAHIAQFRAYDSDVWRYLDGEERLAQIYRVTGSTGMEMNADCIARLQGYTWGHYTKDCSGARGTAARAILNGEQP